MKVSIAYSLQVENARALLCESEELNTTNRSFVATVALSDKFPRQVKELLTLLRLLSTESDQVGYWAKVLEEKIPEGLFPLKIGAPCIIYLLYRVYEVKMLQKYRSSRQFPRT